MAKAPTPETEDDNTSNVSTAAKRLHSFIQRIEKLEEEKKAIAEDVKTIYQEAKSTGFDTKIMRQVVKRRKVDRAELEESDALLANYETNLDSVLE